MKHEDVFSISGRGTVATGCVRNIASFVFCSLILILQVERGIANKGIDLEIIGFGSTKRTTLTGIGEIFFRRELRTHSHQCYRDVPQRTRPGTC